LPQSSSVAILQPLTLFGFDRYDVMWYR
jgi:hypothetical protein